MPAYDAFLLVSFGGPEGPDEVMPFLENVTRGRGIPPERLAGVAEHYYAVGGVSPINQQCRDLLAAIRADFGAGGLSLPVYWGNRNWQPYLADTVRTMAADGVRRAVAFVTSAYSSYRSGPPAQPWLEPDVGDVLGELAGTGTKAVVVVPVGFVSDHMEVRHDLDTQAARSAESLGLAFARAATPGCHPRFVSMITDLVRERLAQPDQDCPADCCRYAAGASRA